MNVSAAQQEKFYDEILDLFVKNGWKIKVPHSQGVCPEIQNGKSELYIHPQSLSGDVDVEHMQSDENAKMNLVKVTNGGNVIQKENYLVVNFAQNFNSKYYKTGDYVQFNFDKDIKTCEGTLLIPCNSSLIARISCIENPKWFSKNAKVFIEMK